MAFAGFPILGISKDCESMQKVQKIAVIIPAYNAESGLEKSVRSVLAQTLRDLEVWIVDDGSKDRTGVIADVLAGGDSRVHVIHQKNCGCYQARLAALKRIKTPYFGFVDADDLIEPTMYEKMLAFMECEGLDVVQCGYDINSVVEAWEGPRGIIKGKDRIVDQYVRQMLVEGNWGGAFVWNKLYRNKYDFSLFDQTDKDTTYEDMIFNLQFFLNVEGIGFLDEPLYHYIINAESSVSNFSWKTLHDFKECIRVRKIMIPKYNIATAKQLNRHWMMMNVRNAVVCALRSKWTFRERMRLAYNALKLFWQ